MKVLVTGGLGFIGSHTVVELLNEGYEVVVLDNLSNSSEKSLNRVEELTGKSVTFYKGDILDRDILNEISGHKRDLKNFTGTTDDSTIGSSGHGSGGGGPRGGGGPGRP